MYSVYPQVDRYIGWERLPISMEEDMMIEEGKVGEEERDCSRRDFLKVTSCVAVAAAGLSVVGCTNTDTDTDDASGSSNAAMDIEQLGEPSETISADLCVIGGGGTGLAAGIEAMQRGIDVICIEKRIATGGSFIGSEGLFAIESHWQKEAGITATVEDVIGDCMTYHHWIPSYDLYYNFFSRTAETVEWLEDLGVEFSEIYALGDSPAYWHLYEGEQSEGTGVQFMKSFGAAAESLELPIRLSTSGKQLIMEDGKVAGVLAVTDEGDVIQIDCKTVIIGTGGYANNEELFEELCGVDFDRVIASGVIGRDGDGIKMAHAVGASLDDFPETTAFYGPILYGTSYGTPVQATTSLQPVLWVNQDCERFVPEDMFFKNFAYAGLAQKRQEKTFTIMTQADIDRFETEGPLVGVGVYVKAGVPLEGLNADIQQLFDDGNEHVFVADSIEELATLTGLDAEKLTATVDTYNGYVKNGKDLSFNKDPEYLYPIEEGPFYAFEVADGYFCTCGGLKVTPNTEVLDEDGEVIPGLYAGGCDAGGFYAGAYDVGTAPGSAASWAINSGRIAAEQADIYLAG